MQTQYEVIVVGGGITGAAIGFRMTFANAMIAILAADAFLIFVAVMTGIISFETGCSTAVLYRTAF